MHDFMQYVITKIIQFIGGSLFNEMRYKFTFYVLRPTYLFTRCAYYTYNSI